MSWLRALVMAGTAVGVACLVLLGVGFVTGLSLTVPYVVSVMAIVTGPPSATMTVGPGMLVVLAALVALIEAPGRVRARRALLRPGH
ncbi:hypothetical protein [Pseudonocardia sp. ICBG1293]|uniref:hypothetical protein n=1 Tax=Pseudonocardia sp. ICBG1293 TaxID=2844382 RepID=UPI001CCABDFE|nr:hypothetical protein [Pseudonocardia sp. ICBG1293]